MDWMTKTQRREHIRMTLAFAAATVALAGATAISILKPEWITQALIGLAVITALFTGIGVTMLLEDRYTRRY